MSAPFVSQSHPTAIKDDITTPPLLTVKSVSLLLQQNLVLEDINLQLFAGQITTVIGPNGAGKSSLMRLLLGLLAPSRGSITRQAGLRMGYVPQQLNIPATIPITVGRFLALPHAAGALRKQEREQEQDHLTIPNTELNIQHLLPRALDTLSGGELQRVYLSRALKRQPQLLVLDEPTQGLDVMAQAELYKLIQQLVLQQQLAVIMVSHDLHLVLASTDQVICLNRHICCMGSPKQVTMDQSFQALFGVYQHQHNHHHV
jgi:zinc transport system ATP-binding protein